MKVWVVTFAFWPDTWEVVAVYDSEEKAKASLPKSGSNDAAKSGCYTVQEFEVK